MALEATVHGAARTVTGSCYELKHDGKHILVDCGLYQGSRTLERLNREPLGFNPAKLDAVLLTHAHLDHSGLLPRLAAGGFSGSIWCTEATADLLIPMLQDAARIQEQEAQRRNRRPDRADEEPAKPIYTIDDALRTIELLNPVSYQADVDVEPGVRARFWNAGHILGSASVEIEAVGVRVLFSGDLGPMQKAFHADPEAPSGLDHVFCESTYGNRERPDVSIEERRALLQAEVETALARGGNLVIPAFALERTQEMLLDLAHLIAGGRLRPAPSVFIDSPLAEKVTSIFFRHRESLEDLGGLDVFRHPSFHFVESVDASIRLNNVSGAIIIAASGMCEAGRIRHHLRHNLPRAESTIMLVGFQAQGTLGRALGDGAKRVRMSGRDVAVRSSVKKLDLYSAHADRQELIAWCEARRPVHGSLFLTHGEEEASETLQQDLTRSFGSIIVPTLGERYALAPGVPARRLATGRTDLARAIGRDWQNDYADLAVNLKRSLRRIASEEQRAEAIRRMREVLDGYADHRAQRSAQRSRRPR